MKVVSDTTLVVKSDEGVIEHPPGTVVDYPDSKAKELVERGLARIYVPEPAREATAHTAPKAKSKDK